MIWRFLKSFWKSLTAIGGLLGILYIWVDIQGLPDALKPPREALMSINPVYFLWGFCVILVGWIVTNTVS